MEPNAVRLEHLGGSVAWAALNRSGIRNVVNGDLAASLEQAVRETESSPDVRAVVLTGAGSEAARGPTRLRPRLAARRRCGPGMAASQVLSRASEPCAWIKPREGETMSGEEVRAFCQGQIARQKVPHHVQFVDKFPMTVTGKAQKFIMRRTVEGQLGLKRAETA